MSIKEFLLTLVSFSEEELKEIIPYFEIEVIKKNKLLLKEGQVCTKIYFIEQGIGRSYYLKKDGKEITQWFFDKGEFMTSADSFFKQTASLYYLEVLEDATIYSISFEKMEILLAKYHHMEKFIRLLSIEIFAKIVHKLNSIQFQTSKERYNYMISEFPNIVYRVSLGHIASYLGMTQETLSRIRRNDA